MTTKKRKQRQYQPAEKVSIIRAHLIDQKAVSDICDEYGIHPSVYYRWQKQFFEGGERAFTTSTDAAVRHLEEEVERLESKLSRKDEVLGEVMEEYVTLKKVLGAAKWRMGCSMDSRRGGGLRQNLAGQNGV